MTATAGKTGAQSLPQGRVKFQKLSYHSQPKRSKGRNVAPKDNSSNCLLSSRQQANLDHRMRLEILAPMALVHIGDSNGNKNREVIEQFFCDIK